MRTHTGLTALHLASECGHTGVVCALLDHNRGPSIYASKASIDTIESASSNDKSLDVNSWTTVENFTALHVAAHSGHVDLIELLLSKYKVRIYLGFQKNEILSMKKKLIIKVSISMQA